MPEKLELALNSVGHGDAMAMMTIKLLGSPVVYTNNTGGGPDELQAPENGRNIMQLPAGGNVIASWFSPLDNISDLPAIHLIDCEPAGTHVNLVAGGAPGHRDARVRLNVYAAVVLP